MLAAITACTTFSDDLLRAERLYDDARYEAALDWLLVLEHDAPGATGPDRLRFSYLRGMTAYRLEQRDEALYYLSLAAELAVRGPGTLEPERRAVLARTLAELTPTDASHRARRGR